MRAVKYQRATKGQARRQYVCWYLYHSQAMTAAEIAEKFGICTARVYQLVKGEDRRQDIILFNRPYQFYINPPE